MSKARVTGFGLSVQSFGAGIEQSLGDPCGLSQQGVTTADGEEGTEKHWAAPKR
jgi:hypothetical protein